MLTGSGYLVKGRWSIWNGATLRPSRPASKLANADCDSRILRSGEVWSFRRREVQSEASSAEAVSRTVNAKLSASGKV